MAITIHPIDVDAALPVASQVPKYTAQSTRQASSVLHGGGSGRPLGVRSGFRVGTLPSVVTVGGSPVVWTLGPCAASIDPGATLHQGGYEWASDSDITGSVDAANATNPRKDILYIQVNDTSAGDNSGGRSAPVLYLAGAPAATPAAPALPERSLLVATIDMPKLGGGAPTVTLNPARAVAAGAPLPVWSLAERDALTVYDGLSVARMDLGGIQQWYLGGRWRGDTVWSEWTGNSGPGTPTANQLWGVGTLTRDASSGINDSGVTTSGNDALVLPGPATWTVFVRTKMNINASGTTFLSVRDGSPTGTEIDSDDVIATAASSAHCTLKVNVTGASKTLYFRFQSGAAGYILTSRIVAEGVMR